MWNSLSLARLASSFSRQVPNSLQSRTNLAPCAGCTLEYLMPCDWRSFHSGCWKNETFPVLSKPEILLTLCCCHSAGNTEETPHKSPVLLSVQLSVLWYSILPVLVIFSFSSSDCCFLNSGKLLSSVWGRVLQCRRYIVI